MYTESCEGCPLKDKAEVNVGKGPADARFLVVVDSPSAKPETYNRLVPQSSLKLFSKCAMEEQFTVNDFYFYPQVRCPYDPDHYSTKEKSLIQKCCRPHLEAQIRKQRPEAIIPLGNEAAKQVEGRAVKITHIRGLPKRSEEFRKTVVLPMLSPLQVVMYPQHEPVFRADFATLGRLVDNDYDVTKVGKVKTGDYEFIDDLEFLIREKPSVLAYDTENTGLRWYAPDAAILTMQFCIEPGKAYLLPWDHPDAQQTARAKKRLRGQLARLLDDPKRLVTGQNSKYDCVYTAAQTGVRYWLGGDTLMQATLLDENALTKGLADLTKRRVPAIAGYCVSPETRIWRSDLTWSEARDIEVGDTLVGFDESSVDNGRRKLRQSTVLSKQMLRLMGVRITMASGKTLTVSRNHEWLVHRGAEGGNLVWRRSDALRPGWRIKKITEVVNPRTDFDAGWLSGILDGEGWSSKTLANSFKVGFAQKPGPVLERAVEIVGGVMSVHDSVAGRDVHNVTCRGSYGSLVVLQAFRPMRLLAKQSWWGCSLPQEHHEDVIVSVEEVGLIPVVSLKTTTHTFVAEGFASHNSDHFDATVDKTRMRDYPLNEDWLDYGCGDADAALRLHHIQMDEIRQDPKLLAHYRFVTIPGLNAFASLELRGQHVNPEVADTFEEFMAQRVAEQRESLLAQVPKSIKRAHADKGIKFSRAEFVRDILFNHPDGFRLKPKVFTKTTAKLDKARQVPSTSTKDHLPYFYEDCPFAFELGEHIKSTRILETNIRGFRKKYVVDGMVRPVYNLHVAVTGRSSSEDPNGQNTPKRGPIAMEYRKMFVAPEDYFLLEADLSQAELRIAADMANDPVMLEIYRTKGDIHTATALIVMSVTMEQFKKLPKQDQKDARTKAKAVNFGFLYGMSWRKFIAYAKTQYGVEFTEREAQRIRTAFFDKYPMLQKWHASMRAFAKQHMQVRSYSGRIRHLPQIASSDEGIRAEAERQAINSPVQEFGSSLGVMALGRMEAELDPNYLQVVGFVHDAIYAYVPKQYLEWGAKTLRWYMETNPVEKWFGRKMRCPIVADVGFGVNLGEVYEMGEFDIPANGKVTVGDYDFDKLWEEGKEGLIVPRQYIPKNNGRLEFA